MNCNGFVASSNLNFDNLVNDISHCLDVGAVTIRSPVSDVELTHIEGLTRLMEEICTHSVCVTVQLIYTNGHISMQ